MLPGETPACFATSLLLDLRYHCALVFQYLRSFPYGAASKQKQALCALKFTRHHTFVSFQRNFRTEFRKCSPLRNWVPRWVEAVWHHSQENFGQSTDPKERSRENAVSTYAHTAFLVYIKNCYDVHFLLWLLVFHTDSESMKTVRVNYKD